MNNEMNSSKLSNSSNLLEIPDSSLEKIWCEDFIPILIEIEELDASVEEMREIVNKGFWKDRLKFYLSARRKSQLEMDHLNEKLSHLESFTGVHIGSDFSFSGHELVDEIEELRERIDLLKDHHRNNCHWKKVAIELTDRDIPKLKKQIKTAKELLSKSWTTCDNAGMYGILNINPGECDCRYHSNQRFLKEIEGVE